MRWLLCILLLAPLASAGTADDPEVTDGDGDSAYPGGARDIVAVWIDDGAVAAGVAEFRVQTSSEFTAMVGAFFAAHEQYRVGFKAPTVSAAEAYIIIRPSQASDTAGTAPVPVVDAEEIACSLGFAPEEGGYEDVSTELRLEAEGLSFRDGDALVCQVPFGHIGGFNPAAGQQITDIWVEHRLVVRGPLAGEDQVGPAVLATFDRAPDDGYGRAWPAASNETIPEPEPEPEGNATDDGMDGNETADPPGDEGGDGGEGGEGGEGGDGGDGDDADGPPGEGGDQGDGEADDGADGPVEEEEEPSEESPSMGLIGVLALLGLALLRRRA